jgi:murein DD-endopeptidase MepM/ murein hydrolase activator NlpD
MLKKLIAKNTDVFFGLLLVTLMSTGCATRPLASSRHGLLDESGSSTSSSSTASVNRRTASEMYSLKSGGALDLKGEWQWPLSHVEISSSYGERSGKFHQGIDLRAPMRTPVMAAADGIVVYVGTKIRGYGKMIVLKHPGNYYTVYAHHSKNIAKMGHKVARGELIAYSGRTGHSSGPHLHFELRQGTQSFDPEYAFNGYFKVSANRKIASKSNLSHEFEE